MKDTLNLHIWEDFHVTSSTLDTKKVYEKYLSFVSIINKLPKKELVKKGWLQNKEDMSSLVPLFQNLVDDKFQVLFRKNTTANEALFALWLSRVTNIAQKKYFTDHIPNFKGLSKDDLKKITKLSNKEASILELPALLAQYGVILVYEEGISGMKLDGAVFKLPTNNPVIGISFRFSRLDSFWFTLMHELAHIVLHFDQLDTPIFDDLEEGSQDLIEKQADRLAKNSFVEKSLWRSCEPKYDSNDATVYKFAKEVGVHPAVIAGLLRHEKHAYDIYSKIIHTVDVRKMVFNHE